MHWRLQSRHHARMPNAPAPPPRLHGLQLWIALPESARHTPPAFAHHPELPSRATAAGTVTVLVGELAGLRSPARIFTPLLGAELALPGGTGLELPLRPDFEYAAVTMHGEASLAGTDLAPGALLYLGSGRTTLTVGSQRPTRVFLLGGEPFEEPLVMWWNFVAGSHDEIVQARADWQAGRRFGPVRGYPGDRLPAPALPTTRLKARDRHGHTHP